MLGAPAGLDEVINYADFKKETSERVFRGPSDAGRLSGQTGNTKFTLWQHEN